MWSSRGENPGRQGRRPGVGHSFVPDSSQDKTRWCPGAPEKRQAQACRLAGPKHMSTRPFGPGGQGRL